MVSLLAAYPSQAALVSSRRVNLCRALDLVSSQPFSILSTWFSRNLGTSGLFRITLPFSIRPLTTDLLLSNWTKDFSCLSINSSTFSTQEGAISPVEVHHYLSLEDHRD